MTRLAPTTVAILLVCFALLGSHTAVHGQTVAASSDLATVLKVGPAGAGHEAGRAAAARLSQLPSEQIATVLGGFAEASPLVKNWLRVIASSVADNGEFPSAALRAFLADRQHDQDARHLAFQLLVAQDPDSLPQLIEGAETDPSLPIRHLAIARLLERAERQREANETEVAVASLRLALAEGRNPDQLKAAADSLEKLGQPVNLANELGMLRDWWTMGTYDNKDSQHFATAYLPETVYANTGRLPAAWLADQAPVRDAEATSATQVTHRVTSDDSLGMIDLNPAFANAKDAVIYAYVEFEVAPEYFAENAAADGSRVAQARLGCITANKVWVNGALAIANEVYHSGSRIDQYIGECNLKPGLNTVLIKVMQNAQTEPWAQDFQFQFRFTDLTGAGLDIRATTPTAK
jgi:hypothetical protein